MICGCTGSLWQTERNKPLELSLISFFQIDPVIAVGGIAGIIVACLKKGFLSLCLGSAIPDILVFHRLGHSIFI